MVNDENSQLTVGKYFTQLVLVEFRNCGPMLYRFNSFDPITLDKVVDHFVKVDDFDEERDSLQFLDEASEISLKLD